MDTILHIDMRTSPTNDAMLLICEQVERVYPGLPLSPDFCDPSTLQRIPYPWLRRSK